MIKIDREAAEVLDLLVASMKDGYARIENSSTFMPVVIEEIGSNPYGQLISVAHYGQQNGDAMRDPDIVLLKGHDSHSYFPVSYRNDFINSYREAVRFMGPKQATIRCRSRMQRDLVCFVNKWMKAIREQQNL